MHRVILEFESSIDKLLWNIPNSYCDEDVDDLKQASKAKSSLAFFALLIRALRIQRYERFRVLERWLLKCFGGSCVLFSCPVIVKSFSNGNEISLDPYCLALMVICNNHYALPPCMYLCSQIVQKCMTKWEKIQSNIPDTLAKWDLFSCSATVPPLDIRKKSEAI